jgi:hypothetical protein
MFLDISEYKIGAYVDEQYDDLPCHLVDFRRHLKPTIALQKDVTINQSDMRPIEAVYSYLGVEVAKLRWTFSVDANNLMTHRKQEICYILNDGTDGDWFIKEDQAFDINRQDHRNLVVSERETSRHSLINDIKIVVIGMLQSTRPAENPYELGGALIQLHSSSIDAYTQTGSSDFADAITNDSITVWLDDVIDGQGTTIRDYVLSRL